MAQSKYLELIPPRGAMYAFIKAPVDRLPDFDDQAFAMELLENRHVLVAPGVSFNTPYRDHFRITNLPDPETLRTVFARLEEELDSWAAGKSGRQGSLRAIQ